MMPELLAIPVLYFICLIYWGIWMQRKGGRLK
jgi:hypothetical protein